MKIPTAIRYLTAAIMSAAIVGAWWYFDEQREAVTCKYKLINPTRCENEQRFANPEFASTQAAIERLIAERKADGISQVSVAFRDLRNGPSININAEEPYLAMSLYKLPIMIRYLKDAEGNPRILDEKITARLSTQTVNQNLSPDQTLVDGQEYTILDLIEKMIRYSDNHARTALVEHYAAPEHNPGYNIVLDTLAELGIVDAQAYDDVRMVSLRSTASIFRILYNASYLNLEQSQRALQLLVESTYMTGIGQPIPSGVEVANKFGYATDASGSQLHDCGIIYYPQHPYVLCVMTKGADLAKLERTIADISRLVYTEVNHRYDN
ncbi:MAG: serine hydrolase [Candidatus Kerfeldbacteria bacterium]|nr:serine hydrolase [Candidatus Kerfeldbacteria bacterium]